MTQSSIIARKSVDSRADMSFMVRIKPKEIEMTITETILAQLGGKRFCAMTGAKNFTGRDDTLNFQIPTANGINRVAITLDWNDTYRVTFSKFVGGTKMRETIVHTIGNVYYDQLQTLFTDQTGLLTRL